MVTTAPRLHLLLPTSAVHRTAPEIWAEIFINILLTPDGRVEMRSDGFPLRLRQVCSAWKQIADLTPGLWTSMTVLEHNMHSNIAQAIGAWLARSGALPLSILISSVNVSQDIVDNIIGSIVPYSARLKHLCLPVNFAITLLHPDVQLPLLEAIGLHMSTPANLSIPASAKQLRDVILMLGPPFSGANGQIPVANFSLLDVGIAWQQLIQLTIRCFVGSIDSLHAILRCCTNLTFFTLDGFLLSPGSVGGQRLQHSGLRSLCMLTDGDPSLLLNSLDLPNLTTMRVDFKGPAEHAVIWSRLETHIALFAWRAGSLQKLILRGFNVSEDDLMWLAMVSPSVKKMSVIFDGSDLVTAAVTNVLARQVNLSYFHQFRVGQM